MSIEKVFLEKETCEGLGFKTRGLSFPLVLQPLTKTVVVAGANGSGKTRLLDLLSEVVEKQLPRVTLENEEQVLQDAEELLPRLREKLSSPQTDSAGRLAVADVMQTEERIAELTKKISTATLLGRKKYTVVRLVPRVATLADSGDNNGNRNVELAENILDPRNGDSEKSAPAYLQVVMQEALEARGRHSREKNEPPSPAEVKETTLLTLLKELLGDKTTFELTKGRLVVNRDALSTKTLSPGQQILFQFGCNIHAQGGSLADCLAIMDEPETHLHPKALLEVVDRLTHLLTGGQLWIATHSVPLVAHMIAKDPECLWFAKDGGFTRGGRTPKDVLESLMGKGGEGAKRLHDFTMLIPQYAALNFSAQCLLEPGSVGDKEGDGQTTQIAQILKNRRQEQRGKLKILDYGAGKGRLLPALGKSATDHDHFDYYANTYPGDSEECRRQILALFGSDQQERYFEGEPPAPGDHFFDVIVMCNVLHEIDPDTWLEEFGAEGAMHGLLAPGGALLIVEDYGMNVGEKAHSYGFLLLNTPELRSLFRIKNGDAEGKLFLEEPSQEERYKDRLIAHLIGRECVARVSEASRREAIEGLRHRMWQIVEKALGDEPIRGEMTSDKGRDFARASQLFVNAFAWLGRHPWEEEVVLSATASSSAGAGAFPQPIS